MIRSGRQRESTAIEAFCVTWTSIVTTMPHSILPLRCHALTIPAFTWSTFNESRHGRPGCSEDPMRGSELGRSNTE